MQLNSVCCTPRWCASAFHSLSCFWAVKRCVKYLVVEKGLHAEVLGALLAEESVVVALAVNLALVGGGLELGLVFVHVEEVLVHGNDVVAVLGAHGRVVHVGLHEAVLADGLLALGAVEKQFLASVLFDLALELLNPLQVLPPEELTTRNQRLHIRHALLKNALLAHQLLQFLTVEVDLLARVNRAIALELQLRFCLER